MTSLTALEWFRTLLWTGVLVAGPAVLAAVVIGFIVAVVQAATQVNDQAVAFGPKMLAVVAALVASGPWMLSELVRFTHSIFAAMERL